MSGDVLLVLSVDLPLAGRVDVGPAFGVVGEIIQQSTAVQRTAVAYVIAGTVIVAKRVHKSADRGIQAGG